MSEEITAIREALAKLDAKNDDHWTENGMPRIDALSIKDLKRAQVTEAAPLFNRANPTLEAAPVAPPVVQEVRQDEVTFTHAELDELTKVVADAKAEVAAAEATAKAANEKVRIAQARQDHLILQLDKLRPSHAHENIMGIRAVLDQSTRSREERAGIAKQLKEVGVTAALLVAGSPLDNAMARKRGFGLTRPTLTPQAGAK